MNFCSLVLAAAICLFGSLAAKLESKKSDCHSDWQIMWGTIYWTGQQHSVFQNFSSHKMDVIDKSPISVVKSVWQNFSQPSFCFSWHLNDSFISPVIYLIFSPLTPPSLSRGGKLQGRQSPGPGSKLARASYPVILPRTDSSMFCEHCEGLSDRQTNRAVCLFIVQGL